MLKKELETIGLSDKESRVYIAGLELGPSPVQDIAQKSEVNRATTYVIIEGLIKKGVFSSFEKGKKRYFVAEAPDSLQGVIRQQQEQLKSKKAKLESLIPELKSLYNLHPNKPVVKFYEGKEGIMTLLNIYYNNKEKKSFEIFPLADSQSAFSKEERERNSKKRIEKNIKIKSIYSSDTEELKRNDELTSLYRVSRNKYPIYGDVLIFDDKVIIASLKDNLHGILIEGKNIAETFKSVMKLAIKGAESEKEKEKE